MRCLHLFLLFSVLLCRAADTGVAGSYTGEWKSDTSGNNGTLRMSLEAAPNDSWKCEITFTLAGQEVKTRTRSFTFADSQLDLAYTFDIQGVTLRTKHSGKWDGKAFVGRYQTTVVDSGDGADAGTWSASRGN